MYIHDYVPLPFENPGPFRAGAVPDNVTTSDELIFHNCEIMPKILKSRHVNLVSCLEYLVDELWRYDTVWSVGGVFYECAVVP